MARTPTRIVKVAGADLPSGIDSLMLFQFGSGNVPVHVTEFQHGHNGSIDPSGTDLLLEIDSAVMIAK